MISIFNSFFLPAWISLPFENSTFLGTPSKRFKFYKRANTLSRYPLSSQIGFSFAPERVLRCKALNFLHSLRGSRFYALLIMFPSRCKLVNSWEFLSPSTDLMLFYEKLTILSVVMTLRGERSSILFRLRLMTMRLVH